MYRGAGCRKHLPQSRPVLRSCVGFQLGGQVDCKYTSEREFVPSDVGRGMSLHVPRSD